MPAREARAFARGRRHAPAPPRDVAMPACEARAFALRLGEVLWRRGSRGRRGPESAESREGRRHTLVLSSGFGTEVPKHQKPIVSSWGRENACGEVLTGDTLCARVLRFHVGCREVSRRAADHRRSYIDSTPSQSLHYSLRSPSLTPGGGSVPEIWQKGPQAARDLTGHARIAAKSLSLKSLHFSSGLVDFTAAGTEQSVGLGSALELTWLWAAPSISLASRSRV